MDFSNYHGRRASVQRSMEEWIPLSGNDSHFEEQGYLGAENSMNVGNEGPSTMGLQTFGMENSTM